MKQIGIKELIVFFFLGMAFQFIAHTLVVYGLHIPDTGLGGIIRARKELLVLGIGGWLVVNLWRKGQLKEIYHNKIISYSFLIVSASFFISFLNSFIVHDQSIITFLLSAKFTYFPLIIYLVGLLVSYTLLQEDKEEIINKVITIIKIVLFFSLGRYILLHTFPNGLDRVGYSQPGASIERTSNSPPPSLWLTEFYTGYVRNQGPFGGPLSLGFYLACLRPLFFIKVLYKKKLSDTRGRGALYIAMTISTFSRATRIMFIIGTILIAFIIYKRYTKKIIIGGLVAVLCLGSYIYLGGKSAVFLRAGGSDSGHKEYLQEGIKLIQDNFWRGLGAAKVGPASYHTPGEEAFNPENQYMQIRLEYGLLGLIGRLVCYIYIASISWLRYRKIRTEKAKLSRESFMSCIPFIGLAGLAVANIVLHPMIDSSSMYPFMMLSGILLGKSSGKFDEEKANTTDTRDNLAVKTNEIGISENRLSKETFFRKYFWKRIRILSLLWGVFFIIQTLLVFTREIIPNTILVSAVRDILYAATIIVSIVVFAKYIKRFLSHYSTLLILISIAILIPLAHFGQGEHDLFSFIAGVKFDIQYFFILLGSLRIGATIYYEEQGKELISYIKRFIKLIIVLVLAGIGRQLAKNIRPDFFVNILGMSLPKDFVPFTNPPIYYITGAGGIQRLSGLFVGPNTLGFLLIGFFPMIRYYLQSSTKKTYYSILAIIILCAIATLSRAAILGIGTEIIILLLLSFILNKKSVLETKKNPREKSKTLQRIGRVIVIMTTLLFTVNHRKDGSNNERKASLSSSISFVSENPFWGKGPGFVGPGRHYDNSYLDNKKNDPSLVENIYLQILINQGLLGLLFRGCAFLYLLSIHYKILYVQRYQKHEQESKTSEDNKTITENFTMIGVGLIGLLCAGPFLHVFIDSTINYLFRFMYGLLFVSTSEISIKKEI